MRKVVILLFVIVMVLGFIAAYAFSTRSRYDGSRIAQLKHENEIAEASAVLLSRIVSRRSISDESIRSLALVMHRLRDEWPGFVVDNDYPHRYGPRHLLDTIYWDIGQRAPDASPQVRAALIKLLRDCPPTDGDVDRLLYYQEILDKLKVNK